MEQFYFYGGNQKMLEQKDYLEKYENDINASAIRDLRTIKKDLIYDSKLTNYKNALDELKFFKTSHRNYQPDAVEIGTKDEMSEEEYEIFQKSLRTFIPWKKGPFKLFGQYIDAEWQSHIKWNRIINHCSDLKGRKVADIGCHNGYFMFKMAEYHPELVIGFEPYAKHLLNFQLMQNFAQEPNLFFELLGIEDIDLYPKFFDTIFCLGILYHHTDPISLLRKMYSSLNTGGEIIIDCQGIDGEEEVALMPKNRYAQARGIWFLPTVNCLKNWLSRTQFREIQVLYNDFLEPTEQRTSEWAPINSLENFLDSNDPKKTVEGYPAPKRFYVKALR